MDLPRSAGKIIKDEFTPEKRRMRAEKVAKKLRDELYDRENRLAIAREALQQICYNPHSGELRKIASDALKRI